MMSNRYGGNTCLNRYLSLLKYCELTNVHRDAMISQQHHFGGVCDTILSTGVCSTPRKNNANGRTS
jgi:hypothetical protein